MVKTPCFVVVRFLTSENAKATLSILAAQKQVSRQTPGPDRVREEQREFSVVNPQHDTSNGS